MKYLITIALIYVVYRFFQMRKRLLQQQDGSQTTESTDYIEYEEVDES